MTSSHRRHGRSNAVPKPIPIPRTTAAPNGRRCPRPTSNRRTRRAADRSQQPNFRRPIPQPFFKIARRKGFTLLARGRRSSDFKLRCQTCQQNLQVRRSVLKDHNLLCSHCQWSVRFADSMACEATITLPHSTNHKIALLELTCGHVAERQYGRISAAANGGHRLTCDVCREARYFEEAKGSGWSLCGAATPPKNGYRLYQHACGHLQSHAIVNVDRRQLDCKHCGETWASKPSRIYLFEIPLLSGPLLKLGYSSDPNRRLRYQLGNAARERGQILQVIDLPTGHAALKAEKKAHGYLRKHHPTLVVPSEEFAGLIKTKSEVYLPAARPHILHLMDQIATQTPF